MRGFGILKKRSALILLVPILALLLPACGGQHHLYWNCENNYEICMEQCRVNNDFLAETVSSKNLLEQELYNCQQECALKQQLCQQSGCVTCR